MKLETPRRTKLSRVAFTFALLSGCGGSDDGFTGSYAAFPSNNEGDIFDRQLAVAVVDGRATVTDRGVTSTYDYRVNPDGGCSISGGAGSAEFTRCVERERGDIVGLCGPADAASNATSVVMTRQDSGAAVMAASLGELQATAGTGGLMFRTLNCSAGLRDETLVVLADGRISDARSGATIVYESAQVAALFGASGLDMPGQSRVGLRAYKRTTGGVTRFYLVSYGAPLAAAEATSFKPAVLVEVVNVVVDPTPAPPPPPPPPPADSAIIITSAACSSSATVSGRVIGDEEDALFWVQPSRFANGVVITADCGTWTRRLQTINDSERPNLPYCFRAAGQPRETTFLMTYSSSSPTSAAGVGFNLADLNNNNVLLTVRDFPCPPP